VNPRTAEKLVEAVGIVYVIVVVLDAQQQTLSKAARAQEQLVRQRFQKRDAPSVVNIVAIATTHVHEVAYPVWYGFDSAIHSESPLEITSSLKISETMLFSSR
jgi:hypothetical protein